MAIEDHSSSGGVGLGEGWWICARGKVLEAMSRTG